MFEPNFVTAPDGRTICCGEHGDPTGPAIFLFHGTPGSRLDHDPYDRPTAARIITIDRPGYGQSDPQPNRRLIDWPADVLAVADALGIERFSVLGISGGGPHDIGEMMAAGISGATDPSALASMSTSDDMPEVDRATMAHPAVQAMMFATLQESMRQGGTAFAEEMIMLAQPWGFALEDIEVEVRFLQGTDDVNVPLAHAEAMAARLPGATLTVMQGEGHMSLAIDHSTPFALELISE